MAEKESPSNTKEANIERSTEDIRHDIAKGEEKISHTVEQIGERIKETLDWREYVKDSPYWAIGAAAGVGYMISRMLMTRTTPIERIMGSIAEEARCSLGGVLGGSARPGLIQVVLMGIASKAAINWIQNSTSTASISSNRGPRPRAEHGSTISLGVDRRKTIN